MSHGEIFYQKFEIFMIFSYLCPYFYTDNVKILLNKTEDLRIHQWHKILSESLKGPAGIALPRRWWILIYLVLFVTLSNDEVCDNGNAIKQCNFQNNYGVISYRKVCSCAPIFKFSYRPPDFSRRANFYQKLPFFDDFWGQKVTLLKLWRLNLACGCRSRTLFPRQNSVKIG